MIRPNVLPLEHVPNARDLGGYVGFDGRKIKMHRLLRTGKLCQMTKEDETFLLNYGLTKIIDLRSPKEIKITPDVIPAGIEHIDNPIHGNQSAETDQKIAQLKKTYTKDQYAGFKTMCHQYYSSVSQEYSQKAFRSLLNIFANTKDGAIIFHCSEGKDRTGLATVLILYLLGVDMETIRQDYLFSNLMLGKYQAMMNQKIVDEGGGVVLRANVRSLASVANEYLDTALLLIDEKYNGLDNYIKNILKIDDELIQSLRELYLEPKRASK